MHALLLVFRLKAAAEQCFFDLHRPVHIRLQALVDGLFAGADGDGRVFRDGLGQLFCGGHQLLHRIHGVDQAAAQRLLRLDVAGGIDQLLRHARADEPGQPLRAAKAGGDAQAGLRLAEDRGIGADPDVTAHGQLTAAAQRKAADGGNGGNGQRLQLAEHIVAQLAEGLTLRFGEGAHLRDICAGHKGLFSAAADHDAADRLQIDLVQRLIQLTDHLIVQGIQGTGPVDDQRSYAAFRGKFYIFHG